MAELSGDLTLPPLLAQIRPWLAREPQPVYLVGGVVRDALLGRVSHDLDFAVEEGAVALSFRVGDRLAAPAYALDRERDIGRVVLAKAGAVLDFSRFRGPDLAADLAARDFTINALALPAPEAGADAIIDVTGGLADLAARRLRLTHPAALEDDPLRCLRAVRLAVQLDFAMTDETRDAVSESAPRLSTASAERVRDEILKMLHDPGSHLAVGELAALGVLPVVLPEIAALSGVPQSPPHHELVLEHTQSVLRYLEMLLDGPLGETTEAIVDPALVQFATVLAPYRDALRAHLARVLGGSLDGRHVLFLAALFHDAGKASTIGRGEDGRIHFYGHDEAGAVLAASRLRALCLSNEVIEQVATIVEAHMRPLLLAQAGQPTRRAIYRFFKRTGANGLDTGLLALADHLATYDGPGPQAQWQALVDVVATLLDHYFERFEESVQPPPLVNGHELMAALGLEPGPQVGELLRLIEEGQAVGEIRTAEEALRCAAEHLS